MGKVVDVAGLSGRERMKKVLAEMQVKMEEIDKLRKELGEWRSGEITPQKSLAMLEEIKVPSLDAIREEKKKAWGHANF